MKAGKEHRCSADGASTSVLRGAHEARVNDFVFCGSKPGRPLSEMAMLMLLRRMGRGDLTVHGFDRPFATGLLNDQASARAWPNGAGPYE